MRHSILRKFLFAWGCFILIISIFGTANARPGGGQNYSSGDGGGGGWSGGPSSFGGSNSSSSGGGAEISPFTALAVLIIVLAYWAVSRKKPVARASIRVNPVMQQQGLLQLQKQDPGFVLNDFLARTKTTMARINEAWIQNSMEKVRRLVSDGIFTRFQTQLNLLKSQGLRNMMLDWKVLGAEFLAAESDSLWDTVHIKVMGAARDIDVPLLSTAEDERQLSYQVPINPYQEIWSFIRRRGKLSKAGVPVLEGHCPNCGADLPISESVKCEHCQAIVNSGEYDFVLSEITQPEEWNITSSNLSIPGLEALQKRDPSISRQALEDRASVLFWKWIEARATGNLGKLSRFCAHPLDQPENQMRLWLQQNHLKDVAVGSADVRQVETHTEEQKDKAWVEIRWSASVDGSEPYNMRHFLALTRSNQVVSKQGLSSLDCPVCGGPLAGSDVAVCIYCQENISGDKYEWALDSISQKA